MGALDTASRLNEHSFSRTGAALRAPPAAPLPRPAAPPKRDAILRAAIDVFAERGFFNAQVADVARAAGVAAGTVYLYFRSKDDLLVSIFERTMREALAEGRTAVANVRDPDARLRRFARLHLARLGRDRNLAIVFQVELRQSTKFMERFSSTLLRDYLGLIRAAIADGQAPACSAAISTRPRPPRCSSARSTRWRPTGFSAAAAIHSRPTPTPSSISSSTARARAMTRGCPR